MIPVRKILREITENRLDPATLTRAVKGEATEDVDAQRGHVVMVLNFYEELAIFVLQKSANEERLYQFFSAIAKQSYARLIDWIRHERKVDNEPGYYSEFERLCKRWSERT